MYFNEEKVILAKIVKGSTTNHCSEIPQTVSGADVFDLRNSNLINLEILQGIKNVKYINLVGNKLKDLSSLKVLSSLQILYADPNVRECPEETSAKGLNIFCKSLKRSSTLKIQPVDLALIDPIYQKAMPEHLEFVYLPGDDKVKPSGIIGVGGYGIVFLARDKNSGELKAVKFARISAKGIHMDDNPDDYDLWRKSFDNDVELEIYKNAVVKTFAYGHTLAQWYGSLRLFNGTDESQGAQEDYIQLYKRIWQKQMFLGDQNPENVILDELKNKWMIVDGRGTTTTDSYEEAKHRGFISLRQWARYRIAQEDPALRAYAKIHVQNFLDRFADKIGEYKDCRWKVAEFLPYASQL